MTSSNTSIHFCRSHDGVQLAYCATGRGPLLIKAATWLSHLQHDGQSPVWRHLQQALGERHKLLRYDERSCGLSDRDIEGFGVEASVADL